MPEFAAPAWLLALALVPLIRWMHRLRDPGLDYPVSSTILWRQEQADDAAGRARHRPERAWRRRAAAAGLLILALARPSLPGSEPAITVWIDDSLSMAAVEEDGASRWQASGRRLAVELGESEATDIVLRSLSNPAETRSVGPGELTGLSLPFARAGRLAPPPAVVLDAARSHWVVTDGADALLNAWIDAAPIQRVLRTGRAEDNAAVVELAARPVDGGLAVATAAFNAGPDAVSRELRLLVDGRVADERVLTLAPGERVPVRALIETAGRRLVAQLASGDAIAEDDALTLDLRELAPLATRIDGGCPRALVAALESNPGLRLFRGPGSAGLVAACDGPAETNAPTLLIHSGAPGAAGAAAWRTLDPRLARLPLPSGPLRPVERSLPLPANGRELLAIGDAPGAVRDADRRAVHVLLDMTDPALFRDPLFPVLISALASTAAGRPLLAPTASIGRDAQASLIRPLAPDGATARQDGETAVVLPLAPWLLLLAASLLGLDAALQYRDGRLFTASGT